MELLSNPPPNNRSQVGESRQRFQPSIYPRTQTDEDGDREAEVDKEAPTEGRLGSTLTLSSSSAEAATAPVRESTLHHRNGETQSYSTNYKPSR